MNQRFLRTQLLSLLVVACGCSPSDSEPSLPSTITITDESAPVGKADDADVRGTDVDPAVDAGMMADEFERNQRINR